MTLNEFVTKYLAHQVDYISAEVNFGGEKYLVVFDTDEYVKHGINGFYLNRVGKYLYARSGNHKYIHQLITKSSDKKVVDHKNRDTLDNRKFNLKLCSIQENLRNQKRSNNKTGVTGVSLYPDGRYVASIKHNYKKYHLGLFKTINDAQKAREKAEILHWGSQL